MTKFLLADRADIRQAFYSAFGRVGVIKSEGSLTEIPEYKHLMLGSEYDDMPMGLGAVGVAPVSTATEDNIACYRSDALRVDDLFRVWCSYILVCLHGYIFLRIDIHIHIYVYILHTYTRTHARMYIYIYIYIYIHIYIYIYILYIHICN